MTYETNPHDGDDEPSFPEVSFDFDRLIDFLPLKEIRAGNMIIIMLGQAVRQQRQVDIEVTAVAPETGSIRGKIRINLGEDIRAKSYDFELRGCFDIEISWDETDSGRVGGPKVVKYPAALKRGAFLDGVPLGEACEFGDELSKALYGERVF